MTEKDAHQNGDLMDDIVLQRPQTFVSSFDKAYPNELSTAVSDVGLVQSMLMTVAGLSAGTAADNSRFHGLALLQRSADTIVSSVQLVRQGASADAFVLLRVAIESAAVAIHITADKNAFARFLKGGSEYLSTKAIGAANARVPRVAELWGALSQTAVHPNSRTFGPSYNADGEAVIEIASRELEADRDRASLAAVSVVAALLVTAAEVVLFENNAARAEWLRLPGTNWTVTATGASLLERRYEAFSSSVHPESPHEPIQSDGAPRRR